MNDEAELLFNKGMEYNLRGSNSFEPSVARGYFEQAAALKHSVATRNLGLMLHQGSGGPKELRRAIKLLARAYFVLGDTESIDCLAQLLHDEIKLGQSEIHGVKLQKLADQLESLDMLTADIHQQLKVLVHPNIG